MRASGVMRWVDGRWRFVQYSHAFPVPNTLAAELAAMVEGLPPGAAPAPEVPASRDEGDETHRAIDQALTDLYRSSAASDFDGYFGHFTGDAIFVGTDRRERYSIPQVMALVRPSFAAGRRPDTRPLARHFTVSEDQRWAWFDEDLRRESLAPMRSTGLLRRQGESWKLVQYTLSFMVPNELVGALSAKIRAVEGVEETGRALSPEQVREDLTFLRERLEALHPALYVYESEEEMHRVFTEALASVDGPQTLLEFERRVAPVIAKVHCVHTRLLPTAEQAQVYQDHTALIPLDLRWISDKLYVLQDLRSVPVLEPGTEICSINQRSAAEVVEELLATFAADGHNRTGKVQELNRDFGHFYAARIGNPGRFEVRYREPGAAVEEVAVLTAVRPWERAPRRVDRGPPRPTVSSSIDADRDLAVLTVRSFIFDRDQHQGQAFDRFFADLANTTVRHLILDLRGNGGGEPEFGVHLLSYLADRRFTYLNYDPATMSTEKALGLGVFFVPKSPAKNRFAGKVYVLVDGLCASTTGHFCSLVRFHGWGTFVGEETGATFTCNDNSTVVTLPHSRFRVNIARETFEAAVTGLERGRGILPDHEVHASVDDVLAGRDTVMEFTRRLIENDDAH